MISAATDATATLWLASEVPVRMIWRGRRWRVTDTPTRLSGVPLFVPPLFTHPPTGFVGWRFQVTDPDGETLMVDVLDDEGTWVVARTYA
jgi:hypothetical protein